MSLNNASVVFHQIKAGTEDYDESSWDDLALSRAYDAAISGNLSKIQQPVRQALDKFHAGKPNPTNKATKSAKNRRKRKKKAKSQQSNMWKVGDTCMAFYQDDQKYYMAVIKEVNAAQGTVIVNFDGFVEYEVLALKDLQPKTPVTNIGFDYEYYDEQSLPQNEQPAKKSKKQRGKDFQKKQSDMRNALSSSKSSIAPDIFIPNLNDIPTRMMPDTSNVPAPGSMSKEALSSMLVSWYMAGYNTGYYQGLTKPYGN